MSERPVIALLALTAVGTSLYWLGFFFAGEALHSSDTDAYLAFEQAFPLADAWMAVAAAAAAVGVARGRSWAVPAGIACGSALVFLGLLDVTFDVERGLYVPVSFAALAEIVINVFCLGVGPLLIGWFWRRRRRLDPAA